MRWLFVACLVAVATLLLADDKAPKVGDTTPPRVVAALKQAGDNRSELESALATVGPGEKRGMEFLISHMPVSDLKTLKADYLVENVTLAYKAWRDSPWHASVPEPIFLNDILPYASIDERRDRWRADFHKRFHALVKDQKSISAAAALLNQKVFPTVGVKYSTKRSKANQSPYESIEIGLASCTGLSVLLIDACRAVGIPARFAGTALWSDKSGNHSWVEIWDDGWHFTGAAEPTGNELNKGWFADRAAQAKAGVTKHAIFATSFRRTPQHFPMVWSPDARDVFAINVTSRYAKPIDVPKGSVRVRFRIIGPDGERVALALVLLDTDGNRVFTGRSKDERFDANDHVTAVVEEAKNYKIAIGGKRKGAPTSFTAKKDEQLVTVRLTATAKE